MAIKDVSVIGVGYVGLTLAAILAESGFKVVGVDTNEALVKKLNEGVPHFYEKGLPQILRKHVGGNLFFQTTVPDQQDVFVLSVGTPVDKQTKKATLDSLTLCAEQITGSLNDNNLVVLRSTVPIGTTRNVVKPILDKSGKEYNLAFCPERTLEGNALAELRELPQVIGGLNETSVDLAFDLFKRVTNTTVRMSSLEAAEMVKLLCNSYRDMVFAYANEVALFSEQLKLDPREVIGAANTGYPRSKIPLPGFVGGSCLVKDPHILEQCVRKTGYEPQIITQSRQVNESIVDYVFDRVKRQVGSGEKIFVSGLAFKGKPSTDDLRDSPAVSLVEMLAKRYENLMVHDFVADSSKLRSMGFHSTSLEEGFKNAGCVIVSNDHEKYGHLDIDRYVQTMKKGSLFFDVWGTFDPQIVRQSGIVYAGIGK